LFLARPWEEGQESAAGLKRAKTIPFQCAVLRAPPNTSPSMASYSPGRCPIQHVYCAAGNDPLRADFRAIFPFRYRLGGHRRRTFATANAAGSSWAIGMPARSDGTAPVPCGRFPAGRPQAGAPAADRHRGRFGAPIASGQASVRNTESSTQAVISEALLRAGARHHGLRRRAAQR